MLMPWEWMQQPIHTATANLSTPRQGRGGRSMEILCSFFSGQEEENEEMLAILMRSKNVANKREREKKESLRYTLTRHLKTCLPQDVLAGQRKRTKATILSGWWMGWADRSLLSPSPSFTLFLSLPPSCPIPPASPPPPPTWSHNLFPPTGGPQTDSTRWQIYWHRHEVKTPQTLSNAQRPTPGETRLKRHLYLLGSR